MSVLFANKLSGKIYKWKSNQDIINNTTVIQPGDPITIEYKKIKIVSDNYDHFGKSQIMITNTIKTEHIKEYLVDNIVYYDNNVKPLLVPNSNKKYHIINNFNHNKCSNEICYYNPGFLNTNTITITTKFWEVDDPSFVTKIINYVKQLLYVTKCIPTPITPYINVADNVLGNAGNFLVSLIGNKELCPEAIIEFSGSNLNKPILSGYYVCLPDINDINIINEIIANYYLEDDTLIKKEQSGELIEFIDTYLIMEVSSYERETLHDYEFITNTNNLINNIIKHNKTSIEKTQGIYENVIDHKDKTEDNDIKEFIKINKECEDFKNIKHISQMINDSNISSGNIKSAYAHLSYDNKQWLNKMFPNWLEKFKS